MHANDESLMISLIDVVDFGTSKVTNMILIDPPIVLHRGDPDVPIVTLATGPFAGIAYLLTVPLNATKEMHSSISHGLDTNSICNPGGEIGGIASCQLKVIRPAIAVTKQCFNAVNIENAVVVTYTGTVSNSGDIALSDVKVVNNQPAPNTFVFSTNSLGVGDSVSFTNSYTNTLNICGPFTDTLTGTGLDPLKWQVTSSSTETCTITHTPPDHYYATAEGKAGSELRQALHDIIRNHNVIPYPTIAGLDTGDALKILDQNPDDTNYVVEIYSGSNSLASALGQTDGWNREHQWPNSYGIDDGGPDYSDLHNLRVVDSNVNSSRGNKYFDFSDLDDPNYHFPAHAEAPLCSTDSDSWEPPLFDRGNIARSLFYMAIRYNGDVSNEPALVLTDDTDMIQSTNAYMGKLSTLLIWNQSDPVDAAEQLRNDRVYSLYQTNRNPFVDHPEWVDLTFAPPHTNPPFLHISPASNAVILSWLATNQSSHLEFSTNNGIAWLGVTNTPGLTNQQFRVVWTNLSRSAWFRLWSTE